MKFDSEEACHEHLKYKINSKEKAAKSILPFRGGHPYVCFFERKRGLSLGWKQSNRWRAAIIVLNWGIVMMTVSFLSIWVFGGLSVEDVRFDREVVQGLVYALLMFALVSISEELLSRGYLQGLFRRYCGSFLAITITSILFAGIHLMNDNVLESPIPLINLFLAGGLLGISRESLVQRVAFWIV